MPIQYSDNPEVLEAIFNIEPGDVIVYGWCWLVPETIPVQNRPKHRPIINMDVPSVQSQIRNLINRLERSKEIMLFQKRQKDKLCCLAIGVIPHVRLSLERVGTKAVPKQDP